MLTSRLVFFTFHRTILSIPAADHKFFESACFSPNLMTKVWSQEVISKIKNLNLKVKIYVFIEILTSAEALVEWPTITYASHDHRTIRGLQ